ncbi:DNA polymerase III subunit gamma/tau [Pseudoflavitalea sp. X16]|uniref:DNA polymerase III subunit gamma/tau n=1 Tax=Paraflavitalea devenefica TaxID=2716334 RepID=UPI00141EDC41|nr:DNA polymerase III subunit gamma/tau [Paraflavitalea devenefica]NII23661.1 DNA polymerase III subunit gamma/tau [Paraflavitalea devenefica]
MDKFIVSARKYRPQAFDTVVGQGHITTTLKNAIKNQQLAHAFLFCGPRGVGKTTCARILAKTINCTNVGADGEACNQCHSCTSFNEGTSMNIHELDAASNNSVDDIRTLVEQVRFAPQAGRYKVYIIDEVHMLSSSAFNAFLKTLEEPPPYAIFILATTEKHKILPTILSRCQIFDFKRITANDTVEHLQDICKKEEINAEKSALHLIAQKSEGCMRDALSIMDKIVSFTNGVVSYQNTLEHLNILDADYYFKLMQCMQQQDLGGAMLLYDDIDRKGFEGDLVLNGFAEFIRNLLVCKDEKVANLLQVVESFKDRYIATSKQVSVAYLISALNILNETEINYKAARNKRLHVELALIKLAYLQQAVELASDGLVKKKLIDEAKPVAFKSLGVVKQQPESKSQKPEASKQAAGHEAKLIIETKEGVSGEKRVASGQAAVGNQQAISKASATSNQQTATATGQPVINQPAAPKEPETQNTKPGTTSSKLGSLNALRQQFVGKAIESAGDPIPLSQDRLHECWRQFALQLKEAKNPANQSFLMATLVIQDHQTFEVVTNNNLEQKFIEGERRVLSEYLQQVFNNRQLLFTIVVNENAIAPEEPTERPATLREKYQHIVEQYPLVKELRDRLKLEVDN